MDNTRPSIVARNLIYLFFEYFEMVFGNQETLDVFASMSSKITRTKKDIDNLQKNIVLLPSTLNPRYLFPLPFAVESWKRLGVEPVVLLIGKESEFLSNIQSSETMKILTEQKVYIQILEPQKLPAVSLSQLIRLFGSVLEFSFDFMSNETVLITSDADLMVFNLFNHIPNVSDGKKIHLYNSQCCESISIPPMRGSEKVHQFPMGTIGATIDAWREIMGFGSIPFSVKDIENYVINEFGADFFRINHEVERGSNIWFADQALISYKINEWLKNSENNHFKSERPEYPRRINRNSWPDSSQFDHMNLCDFDDAHLISAAYLDTEWEEKFFPFLNFAFKGDQLTIDRFIKYRENFTK